MKKVIALVLALVALVATLASCGGKFTCDLCGEEKSGKQHTESILGQEIVYCDDCYEELEEIGKAIESSAW